MLNTITSINDKNNLKDKELNPKIKEKIEKGLKYDNFI